ncbi:MAG TPA: hypothetical protein VKT75_13090 [Acidobacteriaceae bacterium]|nr:hypothetical protein [Acidobacteriaceae bacterium]
MILAPRLHTAVLCAVVAWTLAIVFAGSVSAQVAFDHFATGFPLTGSHRLVECGQCHLFGQFKATPRICVACHNGQQWPGKSWNHPRTTDLCGACHTTSTWSDITTIDHTQATVVCSDCHNGVIAVGKSPTHVVTSLPCQNCHKTTATFGMAVTMDHTGITAPCANCHNGVAATGKPANHIPTIAPCDMCHKSTLSFATATIMDHTGITNGCATCHNNVQALGKPASHLPTNLPCETCHASTVTFLGAFFQHQPTDTNCANCHNNVVATGLTTPPHVPVGSVQCSACHTNTAPSFITYTMNHPAVAGARCDSCHNGAYTSQGNSGAYGTAQHANHVPTAGQDCLTCHAAAANYISWAGATFIHQAGDTNCSSCHNGAIALGQTTPPHIPVVTVQCSNCHTNTTPTFTSYNMNHAAVSGSRCDSCHNGSFTAEGTSGAQGTASYPNHVTTGGRDCIVCHANSTSSFTTWGGGKYTHAATDTNCSSCHNGTTATGMTTPPHIPSGTVQCSNCHVNTAASFVTYTMNHAAVSASRCDSCHNGSFTGEGTAGALGTASYQGHVATGGRDCITCHTSSAPGFTTFAGAFYVHASGDTNCSSCHNGTTATGKSTTHIPVGAIQCSNCHTQTATSFVTYTMNHSAVSASRCDSCHNGSYESQGTKGAYATSSYPGHVAINGQDCITCHAASVPAFTTFAGAFYVHQAGDTNCLSCHNGTNATGNTTPPHIPVAGIQCSPCHTNTATSFATYTMGVTGHGVVSAIRCDACHSGAYLNQGTKGALATSSYPGHVVTAGRDCITCHASAATSFASWANATYVHLPSDTNCINCHNGLISTGLTTPPHIPTGSLQCSNCHTNTAASFVTYTMNHPSVAGTRCDACHNGSYTSEGATGALGTASYPGHVPTNGWDCSVCHAAAAATFTSWKGGAYVHSPTDTNCVNCHNGTTATGLTTPPHVPTAAIQCSNCHVNTAPNFMTYTMNHAAVTSTMRCDTCHSGSYTSQGTQGAQGTASFPGHVATAGRDCVVCHANSGYASWSGGIYVHQSTDTNCTTCHNNTTAPGLTTPPHIPTASIQCSNCHTNTATSFSTYTMNHSAVTSARCDSCHNGSYTSQGATGAYGTTSYAGHLPTNGQDCIVCHAKATNGFTTWSGATYVHQPSDTNCVNCHNGTVATGHSTPPHIPTASLQCSNCHSNSATSFTTYTMNHAAVSTSRCDACHNGSYAGQGLTGAYGTANYPGHVATGGQDCITCHAKAANGYTSWSGGTYVHQPADTNCVSCHNGSTATGMTTPPHVPTAAIQCSNCHTNTATSFATYTMNHSAVSTSRCDACHNGSYTTEGSKGALGTASFTNHVATSGQDCVICHSQAAASFTSWAGGTYVHQPTDTNCVSCHNGKTALGLATPPHVPVGTVQCSACHTNTAPSFTTYSMGLTGHSAVSSSRCDTCHNGSYTSEGTTGALGTASFKGHVATNGWDCITCHTSAATAFTSWAGGNYVHQPSDTNCATCHNGTIALGMVVPPHIPTGTVQCSSCHTNTAAAFTTYVMTHSAVSAMRCDACHNGSYTSEGTKGAQGTASYPNHIATAGRDCITCHVSAATGFTSWAGASYAHLPTDTNCSSCHNGTNALGMVTPPHIPSAAVQCSNCHTNTATSFTTYTMNHASVSAMRCDACHNGSYGSEGTKGAYATTSYAGHVATSGRDCIVCHTSSSPAFTTFAGAFYVHLATDTNCIGCHNGTTATGNTMPPHIPATGIQCGSCHTQSATSFITYNMNHSAVSASRCDACHNGSYTSQGTNGAYATGSYPGHLPTNGRDCIVCHTASSPAFTTFAGAFYSHSASDTNCLNCHNGTTATGNTTPPHIPVAGVQCSPCHSNAATSFATYTMGTVGHGVVSTMRCDACHSGAYTSQGTKGAYGTVSYPNHIATGGRDCITCHASAASSFASWSGGTYSHLPTDTNCVNCHNGTIALGLTTPPHIPTGVVQCSNCHTNTSASFTTYTMMHSAVSGQRCDSCHNGSFATEGTKGAYGTSAYPGHIATGGRDCITCHASAATNFASWAGGGYVHLATDTNCSTCHNGTTALGMTTPPHIPSGAVQCGNCHTNTAASFTTYTMNHTSVVPAIACATCHNGSFTSQGTSGASGTAAYANHVATGGRDCITCHATAASGYTSWAGATYVHLSTDTNCTSCHNGTIALGLTTPPHIPTGTIQCSNCHTNTAASFTTYTMTHSAVSSSRCDACHNGSYTTEGTKGALGTASYSGHVATGGRDCITCHASAATNFLSWSGGTYAHLATDTNCISCHNSTTATGLTTPPHIPTGTIQCSNCHTNTATSFTTYTMSHAAVTGSRCDACHNGSYTSQGTKGAYGTASYAGHVATNGNDCITCHATAQSGGYVSWAGGIYVHQPTDTNCSACHNGVTATGETTPPHIPVTGIQCSNCHTNTATSFTTYTMSHAAVHATRCDACHNGAYKSQGTKGAQGPDHSPKPQDCGCCHVRSTTTFSSWSDPQTPAAGCTTTAKSLVPATTTTLSAVKTAIKTVVTRTINAITTAARSAASRFAGTASQPSGSGSVGPNASVPNAAKGGPIAATRPTTRTAASAAPGAPASLLFNSRPVSTSAFVPVPAAGPIANIANTPTNAPFGINGTSRTGSSIAPNISNFAKANPTQSSGTPKPGQATPTNPSAGAPAQHPSQAPTSVLRSALTSPTAAPNLGQPSSPKDSGPANAPSGSSAAGAGRSKFNHAIAQGSCGSCHNGGSAIGKPSRHVATNAPCETCHKSTMTFAGAKFSHAGSTAACATCHNGNVAPGKPARHIATSAACDTCHKNTVAFDVASMDHASLTAPCATCHNGKTAQGAGQRHFATTLPCDTCHNSKVWSSINYRHASAAYQNHGMAISCTACHAANSQAVVWKFAAYKPDCAGCHAAEFRPQQHLKYVKPVPSYYSITDLKDCSGACHVFADKSLTTITTRRPKLHRVNGGTW